MKWLAISALVIVLTFGAQHLIRYELVKLVGQHIFILISSECPEKISELLVFFIPIAIVTGSTIQCFNVNQHTYEITLKFETKKTKTKVGGRHIDTRFSIDVNRLTGNDKWGKTYNNFCVGLLFQIVCLLSI